jgi:mannose-6-phosphate isomerase class I
VQVHPDDEQARKSGHLCGKTECWYVLRANPGAQVGLGLKPGVTLAQFEQAICDTRAEELLNWVNVYAGDMLYVAAGTVHTIGGGMILVETQQTSDITYRLYDYGRPRELHVAEGLAATKLQTNAGKVMRVGETLTSSRLERDGLQAVRKTLPKEQAALAAEEPNRSSARHPSRGDTAGSEPSSADANHQANHPTNYDANVLVRSPFFQVEEIRLREALSTGLSPDSPHIVVAVSGAGVVESQGMEPISFATGDAVVIPACVREYLVRPQWELEVMRMSLPAGVVAEPQTELPQSASTR